MGVCTLCCCVLYVGENILCEIFTRLHDAHEAHEDTCKVYSVKHTSFEKHVCTSLFMYYGSYPFMKLAYMDVTILHKASQKSTCEHSRRDRFGEMSRTLRKALAKNFLATYCMCLCKPNNLHGCSYSATKEQ